MGRLPRISDRSHVYDAVPLGLAVEGQISRPVADRKPLEAGVAYALRWSWCGTKR